MTSQDFGALTMGFNIGLLFSVIMLWWNNRNDFVNLINSHGEWADETFPEGTSIGALIHAHREIDEVVADIKNNVPKKQMTQEYVDAIFCVLDSARRESITLDDIAKEGWDKLKINKSRQWKDNGDGSYSHIKQSNQ